MTPGEPYILKFQQQVGNKIYIYPVQCQLDGTTRILSFGYNKWLVEEIKSMKGARWSPETKSWKIPFHHRNEFQFNYLMGLNPYEQYDAPLDLTGIPTTRYHTRKNQEITLFRHQPNMVAEILVRHYKIIAGEMGTSKTLSAIIAMEIAALRYQEKYGHVPLIWYVAPRSGIHSVERELSVWGSGVFPKLMTYEGLVKEMKNWTAGAKAPFFVVLDESSKVKNESSQRAQAAQAIGDGVRSDWGREGYLIEMSGSPAPKSPIDWYSQAEIACPGFLKEGDLNKFKKRLGLIVQKSSIDGGVYPQLVTWRDDEKKCNLCGKFEFESVHHPEQCLDPDPHTFVPSKNEVKILYERLKGLVSVYFKKDCLDLPAKHYDVITIPPKQSTLRAAKLIKNTAKTTIEGLTLLRELSDGFQYRDVPAGTDTCPLCKGAKEFEQPHEIPGTCPNCKEIKAPTVDEGDLASLYEEVPVREGQFDVGKQPHICGNHQPQITKVMGPCPTCGGLGEVKRFERETVRVPCPKDDVLRDILDELEDIGRVVVFGGFTGSIDRAVDVCHTQGWSTIRMDQGSVKISDEKGVLISEKDFLGMFQDDAMRIKYPKVAFVAHPKSGGMGLTLTASPTIVYFSNTFDAEDRIQSEDRIHRAGMDVNLGARIVDLVHLPSDEKILDNLKKKRDLQALTLGEFMDSLNTEGARPD